MECSDHVGLERNGKKFFLATWTPPMATRKPAPRLAVPAQRYFKGKAPVKGADPLDFDSDVEEAVEPEEDQDEAIVAYGRLDEVASGSSNVPRQSTKAERSVKVELRDVKVSKEGKVVGAAPVVPAESLGVQGWLWTFHMHSIR